MKDVIAKTTGFYKGKRIYEGQKFQVPDDAAGKWYVNAEDYKPRKQAPAGGPTTFSEINRAKSIPRPVVFNETQPEEPEPVPEPAKGRGRWPRKQE